jgi:SAM-dependent methyltransferase
VSALTYDIARDELVPFVPAGVRRLLDVGCGVGRYAAEVRRQRPEVEVWGVEPDPSSAAAARQHVPQLVEGFFPEVEVDLPAAHFHVVTFNDVLEHLVTPSLALAGAARLLAPGGLVVASIPNVRHLSVLWPLLRRDDWNYDLFGLLDHTHLRFFTRTTMREFFEALGWTVVSVDGVNRRWDWRDGSERRRVRILTRLLGGRLDPFLCVQFVVTARPPAPGAKPPGSTFL